MTEDSKNGLMVTIQCLTYNHEPYIRQCLDGFVMQKTNFRFEAIVHDDASTDGTVDIIKEYAEKYPDIIKPIYETENQYSKRDGSIRRIMNEHTHGKYIAMCEGDDYWIDSLKLQKQVDFLESNHDYSFVCHRFYIYDQNSGKYLKEYGYNYYKKNENLEITKDLFSKVWITQILTSMIRTNVYFQIMPLYMTQYKYARDVHLFYHLLNEGKGISLNDNMGVYRWHEGGVASVLNGHKRFSIACKVYKEIYDYSHDYYIKIKLVKNIIQLLRYKKMSLETLNLMVYGLKLNHNFKSYIDIIVSTFMPIPITVYLVKMYRKRYLKKMESLI